MNYFARKQYVNDEEKNEFFNNFIYRVILFDDHIIILYNTGSEDKVKINNKDLLEKMDNEQFRAENAITAREGNKKCKPLEHEFKRLVPGGTQSPEIKF